MSESLGLRQESQCVVEESMAKFIIKQISSWNVKIRLIQSYPDILLDRIMITIENYGCLRSYSGIREITIEIQNCFDIKKLRLVQVLKNIKYD